ncbi:MAG: vanadium-dependent haloperoxidase [Gemmatirosa sp.]
MSVVRRTIVLTVVLAACAGDPISAPVDASLAATARPRVSQLAVTAAESAHVSVSGRWMRLTRVIIGRRALNPLSSARAFALVAVAQRDAILAAQRARALGANVSTSGAAGAAAATVLTSLLPAESLAVRAQLALDATELPVTSSARDSAIAAGAAIGRQVGAQVFAYGAADGSATPWVGSVPVGPGLWSIPAPAVPTGALWGMVRPWFMATGDQFRPPPPPEFGSPELQAAVEEVRRLTDARTPEQLRLAQYWASTAGPGGPAGIFAEHALQLAERYGLDEERTAHVLAVMLMAQMDASIACWDAKFAYWNIRPYQVDPAITTPLGRPGYPAYPSGHACLSSAATGVLSSYFPTERAALQALLEEAGESRIYSGLHYRFDVTAGQALGARVATLGLARAPRAGQGIVIR